MKIRVCFKGKSWKVWGSISGHRLSLLSKFFFASLVDETDESMVMKRATNQQQQPQKRFLIIFYRKNQGEWPGAAPTSATPGPRPGRR